MSPQQTRKVYSQGRCKNTKTPNVVFYGNLTQVAKTSEIHQLMLQMINTNTFNDRGHRILFTHKRVLVLSLIKVVFCPHSVFSHQQFSGPAPFRVMPCPRRRNLLVENLCQIFRLLKNPTIRFPSSCDIGQCSELSHIFRYCS